MMKLDNDRILEKIDELENYLRELEEYLPEREEEYLNNSLIKRACERAFQLASENLLATICNTENPAIGGASPGSGVATPAP